MAFYDKYIPKELKNPIDDILDFGTDTFKKTGRAIRKTYSKRIKTSVTFFIGSGAFYVTR